MGNVKDFYESNIRYLGEVIEQPVPYLEISWCTRFNAFLPEGDVWNYLLPDSGRMTKNFESDNEGMKIWPSIGDKVDSIQKRPNFAQFLQQILTRLCHQHTPGDRLQHLPSAIHPQVSTQAQMMPTCSFEVVCFDFA